MSGESGKGVDATALAAAARTLSLDREAAEAYVKTVAAAVGLTIPPEYLPGTVLNLTRSAALAAQLFDFPLPSDVEPAAVYRP